MKKLIPLFIVILIFSNCKKRVEFNEEILVSQTIEYLIQKTSTSNEYFVSPLRSGFDFDYFNTTGFEHYSKFSEKVKDSVLTRLEWDQNKFEQIKANIENKDFKDLSNLSKGDYSRTFFCVSPIDSNIFFIHRLESFKKFHYEDLDETKMPDYRELTSHLSLVVTLKDNEIDKIFYETSSIFNCF